MQHHSEDFRFTDDFGIARCTGGRKEGPRMAYNSCRDKKKGRNWILRSPKPRIDPDKDEAPCPSPLGTAICHS